MAEPGLEASDVPKFSFTFLSSAFGQQWKDRASSQKHGVSDQRQQILAPIKALPSFP
jgi:hypothetical protein